MAAASAASSIGCNGLLDVDTWDPTVASSSTAAGGAAGASASSGAAGGSGGAGGTGGGSPAGQCGKTTLLRDEFAGTQIASWWETPTVAGGATVSQNGEIIFQLPPEPSSAELRSSRFFDLRDASVEVRVGVVPGPGTFAAASLVVGLDAQRELVIRDESGTLGFERTVAIPEVLASTQYVQTDHVYWRIRETAGTVFWETSPDGAAYTVHAQEATANLFPLDVVGVTLRATREGAPGPTVISFDGVNPSAAPGLWCPVASLVDGFDGGMVDAVWASSPPPIDCQMHQSGGQVVMTPMPMGAAAKCRYDSARDYDLRGSAATIEVTELISSSTGSFQGLLLRASATQFLDLYAQGGMYYWRIDDGAQRSSGGTSIDPADARFWRLRENDGKTFWEVSPDRGAWTELHSADSPFQMSQLQLTFGIYTDSAANQGTAKFAGVNAP